MKRKTNITKFERSNRPYFRVYNGQGGRTEIHFNELAAITYKIDKGDQLLIDAEKNMFTVVPEHQEITDKKGFMFSRSDKPNIFWRSQTKDNLKSGQYEIDPNKVRVAGAFWVKFEWKEDLQSKKTFDVKPIEKSKGGVKEVFDFLVNDFESQGRKMFTLTCKVADGKKIGMANNKYLVIAPDKNMLAVAQRQSDPDSDFIGYRAYVIKKQQDIFKVVNIHKQVFKKTGMYTLTEENVFDNNQKFYKFYFNKQRTKTENKIRNNRDDKEKLLQKRPIEKDSFKYEDVPMVKTYFAKTKEQKQLVILINFQLANKLKVTDGDYVSVEGHNMKFSKKRKEKGRWYKIRKTENQLEARANAEKIDLGEGDYSAKVGEGGVKLIKVGKKDEGYHYKYLIQYEAFEKI